MNRKKLGLGKLKIESFYTGNNLGRGTGGATLGVPCGGGDTGGDVCVADFSEEILCVTDPVQCVTSPPVGPPDLTGVVEFVYEPPLPVFEVGGIPYFNNIPIETDFEDPSCLPESADCQTVSINSCPITTWGIDCGHNDESVEFQGCHTNFFDQCTIFEPGCVLATGEECDGTNFMCNTIGDCDTQADCEYTELICDVSNFSICEPVTSDGSPECDSGFSMCQNYTLDGSFECQLSTDPLVDCPSIS